ncbi:DUF1127 domain-containing protein [Bradyrhizobium betae]|uniref:DUF1127 domain-containing protein n=1 Tax=Bradyrhizobium betae TaxID=244734 RepID=A0A5P6PC59_9BRAD|nr:DUF1127 domain-containing protein [Bradyrhizobium betae]MCS3731605.1 uncharacterized protein YjiS (DUF1127 family) [Bradyrhizobium betae]QFI75688.1 DUF1127 domain-containing protein [Bradyrhizobium betae]
MPPQLTSVSSGIERDAARRRLDLSVISSPLRRYWRAFQQRRQRSRVTLQDLNDRELMDIGLTRGEIDYVTPERAIDRLRDSTMQIWGRGGM